MLLGAWRYHGLSVSPDDLNVGFFNYLCSAPTLARQMEWVRRKLSLGVPGGTEEENLLRRSVAMEGMLAQGVARALGILRDKREFYEPSRYAWASRFIGRYLEAVCAPFYPGRVTLQSFQTAHSHLSSRDIIAATTDGATNPFLRYCEEELAERYRRRAPDVVAISVTFQTQLIPGFTFARCIKQWLPGTRVVMGGAALARSHDRLALAPHLFRDVDAVILFEGETAFPALLTEWERGNDGRDAPNVMLRAGNRMLLSERRQVEDLEALPPPDHAGLALGDYWWPEPALLYNCARGCYWGRCAFCQISPATVGRRRGSYRKRSTARIVSDLRYVHQQTGARSFNLAVDALPPEALFEIGTAVKESGLPITWDTEIRLDKGLNSRVLSAMAEGGCRHVRFGFESASQRVLDLMNKGTTLATSRSIIEDCREAGITVSLMCQIGFPGETYDESMETVEFLKNSRENVAFLSIVPYVLESGSTVFSDPARFGTVIHPNPEDEDLSWMYSYEGPEGRGVRENYSFFEKVERSLDEYFPDRDLFFKGGLGHAHTSLYVRCYPFQTFIEWNRRAHRLAPAFHGELMLQAAPLMSIAPESGTEEASGWSRFTVVIPNMPEYLFTISGSALPILAACTAPLSASRLADWICRLSAMAYTRLEAMVLVRDFYENGLLQAATGDVRAVLA